MANWFYYNENNEKIGPVRGRDLKQLARQGMVMPETRVEDENGQIALAKNVTGLTFSQTGQSETAPSKFSTVMQSSSAETNNGTRSTAENLEEQDFEQLREDIERLQKQQEQEQAAEQVSPPVEANPFTATIPAEPNPFAAAPPVLENPFVAHVPKAIPPNDFVPSVKKNKKPFWTMMTSVMNIQMDWVASMTAFVLTLLLCGFVMILLLNLFYVMHPGVVPPKWLKPVIPLYQQPTESLNQQDTQNTDAQKEDIPKEDIPKEDVPKKEQQGQSDMVESPPEKKTHQ